LQETLLRLVEATGIPVAATLLGKSVIGEQHPLYLGVYEGAMGREEVRRYVESSDCVIMLGVFMTDINLGVFTARLDPARCVYATSERMAIRYHTFEDVRFKDFMRGLLRGPWRRRKRATIPRSPAPAVFGTGRKSNPPDQRLTVRKLFERLNCFLREDTTVISDVGDALFGAADLSIHRGTEFLAPAYYTSMGFAIPAAVGAQLANPKSRPLVLVGDGAFQMTGMELATLARYRLNPIVVVLNNRGYGTERPMQDGPYNDVWSWQYHRFPEVLGAGRGFVVETERDLNAALVAAEQHTESFCLIEARLDPADRSPALQRLTERLAKRI
jgi:indolepyruvate decarboxylase